MVRSPHEHIYSITIVVCKQIIVITFLPIVTVIVVVVILQGFYPLQPLWSAVFLMKVAIRAIFCLLPCSACFLSQAAHFTGGYAPSELPN